MKNIVLWVFKQFVLRITETSTWISSIGLILFSFEFTNILTYFFIFGIFTTEAWFDNFAKEKGEKIKEWIRKHEVN